MTGIKMRFRVDSWSDAQDRARMDRGEELHYTTDDERAALLAIEPARPGDVWRVHWYHAGTGDGPIAGYAIGCITCGLVHPWTTALNCSAPRRPIEGMPGHSVCIHSGTGSCWTWTGSAEEGTLSATPSLHSVKEKGGCGYHGFLTNGVLT